jgi:2-C-methyl-D-erythritol 4-phosphate cytidylyltransferase
MDRSNTVAAIIVAAGEGVRMGTAQRKQYAMLRDRPVLAHTLSAFERCDAVDEIFLVIPEGDHELCRKEIVTPLKPQKAVHLVSGGPTRQASVLNGLKTTDGRFDLVTIHDGVRPLVRVEQVAQSVSVAARYGGCIPAVHATDTVKRVDEQDRVVSTLNRAMIRMAQTPQTFHYRLILAAHMAAQEKDYAGTDDAELVELYGEAVKVIPGDPQNIKITTPEDLKIAEALLNSKSECIPR